MGVAFYQYSVKYNDICAFIFPGTKNEAKPKPDTYGSLMLQHLQLNSQLYVCAGLCTNNCIDLFVCPKGNKPP